MLKQQTDYVHNKQHWYGEDDGIANGFFNVLMYTASGW